MTASIVGRRGRPSHLAEAVAAQARGASDGMARLGADLLARAREREQKIADVALAVAIEAQRMHNTSPAAIVELLERRLREAGFDLRIAGPTYATHHQDRVKDT